MTKGYVYIEGERDGSSYHWMWRRWGFYITPSYRNADVIQFTGGEDVNPALYGEAVHPNTFYNERRDQVCIDLFHYALDNGIPMVGICRGGQFLNVMNAGTSFQHCDGHAIFGTHKARIIESGLEVDVTSTHHQIMRPNRQNGIVLMEADKLGTFKEEMMPRKPAGQLELEWYIANRQEEDDVEAIYYPDTNSLCYQPHPEYCEEKSGCVQAYKSFVRNYVGLDV